MAINDKNRPSNINSYDNKNSIEVEFDSLKEYIAALQKGEEEVTKKINKLQVALQRNRVNEEFKEEKSAILELAELKQMLEKRGIAFSQKQQEEFLKDFERKKRIEEQKELTKYWDSYSKKAKKQKDLEEKEVESKLKSAQLRSTIKENGEDKSKSERFWNNLAADINDTATSITKWADNLGEEIAKGVGRQIGAAIGELTNSINSTISTYADYRSSINTRLQGSMGGTVNAFNELENRLKKVSYSPLISTESLYANLNELVSDGIAFNLDQRAFLMTIKDGIANTFDANSNALKRIIRLQQEDSTAMRLGMEAYLTSYLNELTKNTEYLTSTFDEVAESLLEASALLSTNNATEFEYVVQKWLGTMTGFGLSSSTATGIAQALGKLGSGDVSVVNSEVGRLLMMAAQYAGLDTGSLLEGGLSADKANQLLYSAFSYLGDVGKNNSNVVKSQLAQTFGVSVSDLVAVGNLFSSGDNTVENLYNSLMTTSDMISELGNQSKQMAERLGMEKILENLFSNFKMSQGMNIASSPALYSMWKITDLIQGVTGGINIPAISVMGNMVDLNTTVENLMKIGIIGMSTLGSIGDIISGVGNIGSLENAFRELGIGNAIRVEKGVGLGSARSVATSGVGTSISTLVGNSSGSAFYSEALGSAESEQNEKLAKAKAEEVNYDEKTLEETEKTNSILEEIKKIIDAYVGTPRVHNEDEISGINGSTRGRG